jgi:sulfur relay (sulfurtransferase) DsrC/TusE family protein
MTSDLDICIAWKDDCYDENGVLKPFTKNMRQVISTVTKGKQVCEMSNTALKDIKYNFEPLKLFRLSPDYKVDEKELQKSMDKSRELIARIHREKPKCEN